MNDQRRTQLNRAAQERCGGGVVDDQGNALPVGNLGQCRNVGDIAAGVGDSFAENRAGVFVHGLRHRAQIFGVNELSRPAKAFDRLAELGDGSAIKP
jgi:hypothetical protein